MFIPELVSLPKEDISILLKLDNHVYSYLCDCGDAGLLTIKDCQHIRAVFISHTHIDHFVNFDFLLRHQIGIGRRIIICGPSGIADQVRSKIRGYTWNLIGEGEITYEVREIIREDHILRYELRSPEWEAVPLGAMHENAVFRNDRFRVNFAILDHQIPSIAYLFTENDSVNIDLGGSGLKRGAWIRALKAAFTKNESRRPLIIEEKTYSAGELFHLLKIKNGDTLGVIMDHAAVGENYQKIRQLFTGCNRVFIESFYNLADKDLAAQNHHSYSEASGRIMRECGVKEAIPVHFSRKYEEEEIETLIAEFKESFLG